MLQSLLSQAMAVAVLSVCFFAIFCGSNREQQAGWICLIGTIFSLIWGLLWPETRMIRHLLVDGLVLLGYLTLCWKTPHPWPLWTSGLQLFSLMSVVATLRQPEIATWTFLTLSALLGWGVLLTIMWGTLWSMRQKARSNTDRSPNIG